MLFYWTGNLFKSCNGEGQPFFTGLGKLLRSTNQFDIIQHDFIKETSRKGNITRVDM